MDFDKAPDLSPTALASGRTIDARSKRPDDLDAGKASYYTSGGACDGKLGGGCMLSPNQRLRLEINFASRTLAAEGSYKLAIESLRVDELLRKEGDLAWVGLLLLDVLGMYFVSTLVTGFTNIRAKALEEVEVLAAGLAGAETSGSVTRRFTRSALELVNPEDAKIGVKLAIDGGKKQLGATAKTPAEGKAANLGFLRLLRDQASVGFQAIRETLAKTLSDVELLAATDQLDAAKQTAGAYENALREKLGRFDASGATKIGRTLATHETMTEHGSVGVPAVRDTRVVWVVRGSRLELRYQTSDGARNLSSIPDGLNGAAHTGVLTSFGPPDAITAGPELGNVVPTEFIDVALALHQTTWGDPPTTVVVPAAGDWYDADGDGQWFQKPPPPSPPQPVPADAKVKPAPILGDASPKPGDPGYTVVADP